MNHKIIIKLLVGTVLATASISGFSMEQASEAPSGVISSGGGKLFRYSDIPWAFKNTPEVSYCLIHDPKSFSQSIDMIRQRTQEAFGYWESIFQNSFRDSYDAGVGTQSFVEVPCDEKPTVKIQFGFLTKEQKAFVASPQDYVGLTVPTYQDRKNLVTKGYIYVGADKGPLKMSGEDVATDPWARCNGCAIAGVVFHELGHVFGFKHNLYPNLGMMDEKIPEMLVNKEIDPDFLEWAVPFYIKQNTIDKTQRKVHSRVYMWDKDLIKLLSDEDYLEIVMNPQTQYPLPTLDMKVYAGSCKGIEPGQRPAKLREVLNLADYHHSGGHNDYALRGRLPKEQSVFSEAYFEAFSIINYRQMSGKFSTWDGTSFTGLLRFDHESGSLRRLKDDRFSIALAWDSYFTSMSKLDRHLGCPTE